MSVVRKAPRILGTIFLMILVSSGQSVRGASPSSAQKISQEKHSYQKEIVRGLQEGFSANHWNQENQNAEKVGQRGGDSNSEASQSPNAAALSILSNLQN